MLIGRLQGVARACVRFAQGRRRTFRRPEDSDRRRQLDTEWGRSFAECAPTGGALRSQLSGRWARFHIRGDEDAASDDEAVTTLRGLLDDLRRDGDQPLRLIVQEYGSGDLYGGWSKSLPVELFAWRTVKDEWPTFYWASDPAAETLPLEPVFMSGVQERGYAVITDETLTWAFCPYWAGVDVIFASPSQRDDFVAAHLSLSPNNAMGL
jgi:hypothetical protein